MEKPNILIIVVCGLVNNEKILLLKRNNDPYKDHWVMPGGKLKFGETLDEAAVREFFEETGIKATCKAIKGLNNEVLMSQDPENKKFEKVNHFFIFVAELESVETKFKESDEGELRWFDINEIDKLKMIPSDILMVKEFLLNKDSSISMIDVTMKEEKNNYKIIKK